MIDNNFTNIHHNNIASVKPSGRVPPGVGSLRNIEEIVDSIIVW